MMGNYKFSILIFFCFNTLFTQLPFQVGEKLIYDIDFRIFNAGKATLEIQQDTINGENVFKITAITRTNSFLDRFYKVRDRIDAWIAPVQFSLIKVQKKIRERKYKKDHTAVINHQDSTAITGNKTIKLPGMVMDPTSAIYYFRTLNIELDDQYRFYSYDNGKVKEVMVQLSEMNNVSVPAGIFDCFIIEPTAVSGKLLKNEGEMKIWISKDSQRLPIKIEQKTNIGNMVLNLREVLKNPG